MKPKQTTIEGERDERRRAVCDQIIYRAATMMVGEAGAPVPMMIDRLLTFAAAQAAANEGSARAAKLFRQLADNVERGAFNDLTGENLPPERRQ